MRKLISTVTTTTAHLASSHAFHSLELPFPAPLPLPLPLPLPSNLVQPRPTTTTIQSFPPSPPHLHGYHHQVDEVGVDARDIELVMKQALCTRATAIAALQNNDGDIVIAIMELA